MKIGPVVNKAQQAACYEGLRKLKEECSVAFGGDEAFQPLEADRAKSAFVQPTLLVCNDGLEAKYVHDVEVFGPAATLVAYDSPENLIAIARRGLGSLVASIFSNDADFVREVILGIGDMHGRIVVVDSSVGGATHRPRQRSSQLPTRRPGPSRRRRRTSRPTRPAALSSPLRSARPAKPANRTSSNRHRR